MRAGSHDSVDRVAVVGGGVIGLCTAYYLREAGVEVTILERDRVGSGASRGNAGEVCPGLATPLPAPGVLRASLRTLHRRDSALYVRPRVSAALARFLLGFAWATRGAAFSRGVAALGALARDAVTQYREMESRGVRPRINARPYIHAFASHEDAEAERASLQRWSGAWIEVPDRAIGHDELAALEPCLSERVSAGLLLEGQVTVDPASVVESLAGVLRDDGVEIREGARVTSIASGPGGVTIETSNGRVQADTAVLSAGIWTVPLARSLGVQLPIYPGKGYSFTVPIEARPQHLIALEAAHVGLAPLEDGTRIAGTMEINGDYDRFDPRRIEAIVAAARPYLRGVDWDRRTREWVGPRPMTPNGLPWIGALDGSRRVFVAAGHNMLGVTLAPGTGRAVAELVTRGRAGVDLSPFAPRNAGRGVAAPAMTREAA